MKTFLTCLLVVFLFGCEKSAITASAVSATGQGGSLARFAVVGNYLYAVDKENMSVFDISEPSQPSFVRSVEAGFEIETIFPFKDKLFVGSASAVHIFSIDDPSNPQKLSEAISPTVLRRCDPVVARDSVAYATLRTNGPCGGFESILAVYDITDVKNPVERKRITVNEPYGLGYYGNSLYVCDRYAGLLVFDITNAFDPVQVQNVRPGDNSQFIDVIPYNNVLICWTTAGMKLYDISKPQDPVLIREIS